MYLYNLAGFHEKKISKVYSNFLQLCILLYWILIMGTIRSIRNMKKIYNVRGNESYNYVFAVYIKKKQQSRLKVWFIKKKYVKKVVICKNLLTLVNIVYKRECFDIFYIMKLKSTSNLYKWFCAE